MNIINNETENTKLYELFLAIYFNDVEKVIDFKNRYPQLYAMKNSFLIDGQKESHSFDLMNLTFFNQAIWSVDSWINEIRPFIEKIRQQTTQMLDYWRSELGRHDIMRTIEYNHYWDCFYCEDPAVTNEIGLSESIQDYVKNGYREIDLMLYNRAECFDFIETKRLLELEANPDITFYENKEDEMRYNGYNILDRIGDECSFLGSCEVLPYFKKYDFYVYYSNISKKIINNLFGDLLGLAAHEEMYKLLTSCLYDKKQS